MWQPLKRDPQPPHWKASSRAFTKPLILQNSRGQMLVSPNMIEVTQEYMHLSAYGDGARMASYTAFWIGAALMYWALLV